MTARAILRSPWRVTVAGALLLLLLNAATYLVLTRPRQERSRRAVELSAKMAQALDEERAAVERLRLRARNIETNRLDAKQFFSRTIQPQEQALSADLEALEEALRQAGLGAERRSYRRKEVSDLPLVRLDHQLTVSGSSDRLTELLGLLERSQRFILIDGIRLRQEAEGPSKLDATLATFYTSDATPAGAARARPSPRSEARASR